MVDKKEEYLYKNKKCKNPKCNCKDLKKRSTKPYTASRNGHLYFDYYQCPVCKTNYGYGKERH